MESRLKGKWFDQKYSGNAIGPREIFLINNEPITKYSNKKSVLKLEDHARKELIVQPKWEKIGRMTNIEPYFNWTKAHKVDLEPKMISHIWLLLHNAIITGEKLRICNKGIYNQSQEFPKIILPLHGVHFSSC
ncbi:hypothetical protein AYI69_g5217 [Smittium culicis]|uniref:Uncharacterized protein n=1 Tax=Smittium culicis TaxID=133412 RepID=A0A1R1Y7I7_9FUNG|nr:hypothetical protein AYI69_g5217 [Smittium culicis]